MVTLRQKVFFVSRPFGLGDDTPRLASPGEPPKFAAINCPLCAPAEVVELVAMPECQLLLLRGEWWAWAGGVAEAPAAGEVTDLEERERDCGLSSDDESAFLLFHRAWPLLLWLFCEILSLLV